MMSRKIARLLQLSALSMLVACSSTMGETSLSDGNKLVVVGSGVKSEVSVKCLTAAQIMQLTGSGIDPAAKPASCYTVVFVSASSSSISKAITAYVNAESELSEKVTATVAAKTPPPANEATSEIADKIVADAVAQTGSDDEFSKRVTGVQLSDALRTTVTARLRAVASTTTDEPTRARLNHAATALEAK